MDGLNCFQPIYDNDMDRKNPFGLLHIIDVWVDSQFSRRLWNIQTLEGWLTN